MRSSSSSSTRVVVVGGGVAGLSTAWWLVGRGVRDVVVCERERLLGTQSSGRNAAILRTLSGDPATSALARRGAAFLHDPPEGFSEVPLVEATGLLLTAEADGAEELRGWFEASGRAAGGEEVDRARARELAPHLDVEPEAAFLFPREGRIDTAALLAGFERGARAGGAAIETGVEVRELLVRGGAVRGVRLADGEELEAAHTVLAAGGWAGRLGRAAGSRIELRPTRRHLLATSPDPAVDPTWPVVWHHGAEPFYSRPESGGLLACACDQDDVDPDRCPELPEVRELVAERVARYHPAHAEAGVRSFWAGLRTFSDDGRFAIGADPDLAGLAWVAALGGHGMVCGPAVGELAAAALGAGPAGGAASGAAAAVAGAFDPARLAETASRPDGPRMRLQDAPGASR